MAKLSIEIRLALKRAWGVDKFEKSCEIFAREFWGGDEEMAMGLLGTIADNVSAERWSAVVGDPFNPWRKREFSLFLRRRGAIEGEKKNYGGRVRIEDGIVKGVDIVEEDIKKALRVWNDRIIGEYCEKAGIAERGSNKVEAVYYEKGVENRSAWWEGTLRELAFHYIKANRGCQYMYNCYWMFRSKEVERAVHAYMERYEGNICLDEAVSSGCIID